MQKRNHALTDEEEHADRAATAFRLGDVAVTSPEIAVTLAAHGLRAENVATQQAQRRICQVAAAGRAAAVVRQVYQHVEVLG